MKQNSTSSTCLLCGADFSRKGMLRHISKCLKRVLGSRSVDSSQKLFHLHVSAAYDPDYFLHLLVSSDTTLKQLDKYLRDIWLECCGHLSAFFINSNNVELKMGLKLMDVSARATELSYQYDFGSTTELAIRLVDFYPGTPGLANRINLLSRNAMPVKPCDECGKTPAVEICTECQWDDAGYLCEKCAPEHECGEEMLLPIVNSPRSGVCGYSGGNLDNRPAPEIFKTKSAAKSNAVKRTTKKNNVINLKEKRDARKPAKEPNPKMERAQALVELISPFCREYLDEDLESYAIKLIDTLRRKRNIDITKGRIEIWASAVLYVIARLNFLFDPESDCNISADTICDFFQTKKSTVSAKATQIEEKCDLAMGEEGYCSQEIHESLSFYETPQGLIFPKNMRAEMEAMLGDADIRELTPELLNILMKPLEKMLPQGAAEYVKADLERLLLSMLPDEMKPSVRKDAEATAKAIMQTQQQQQSQIKYVDQQEKIAESEKEKIDEGQLTIFDD